MAGKNLKVALQVQADSNQAKREIGNLRDEIQKTAQVADASTASQGKTSKAVGITAEEVKKLSGATNLKGGISQLSDYENWLAKTSVASKNVADSNKLIENSISSMKPHLLSLIGLSGGFIAVAVDTLNKAAELQNLSNVSGMNVEQFQYSAAGAKKVGIEVDKLSQIFQDSRDKVGDYLAEGGGELQQFFDEIAPKVGVTAKQFEKLNGDQILQLYVKTLKEAGVSGNEMVTHMERMASDSTRLIPLYEDNAAGLQKYGDAAKDAGAILSQEMVDNAVKAKSAMGDFQNSVAGVTNKLVANAAPAIVFVAENLDVLVRAGLIVASVFAGRMIASTAATTIAFIAGRIEAIKYQMALASMAGIATTTAARLTALSTVAKLLTLAGGLPGLAIAAAGVAASFLLMPSSSDAATDSLDNQSKSVTELAEEYLKLDSVQKRVAVRDAIQKQDELTLAYKVQQSQLTTLIEIGTRSSDVSEEQRRKTLDLIESYKSGKITANQLATEYQKLNTVKATFRSRADKVAVATNNAKQAMDKQNLIIDVYTGKADAAALASDGLAGDLDNVGTSADGAAAKVAGLGKAYQDYIAKLGATTMDNINIKGLMDVGVSEQEARMRQELLNAKNADPKATQTFGALTNDEIAKIKGNLSAEEGVKNISDQQRKNEEKITKEKEKQAKLALTQKAISAASNEQTRKMLMVYQSLTKAGLPDSSARYFTAEIGREGSYLDKNLFGSHEDANNGYTNTGMISWQKGRSTKLMAYLKSKGVLNESGQIKQTQEALDAQAEFLVNEILTDKSYSSSKNALLSGKSYKHLQQIVGNNYIGWDIKANTLSQSAVNKNVARMDSYHNQINSVLGDDPNAVLSDFSKVAKIQTDFVQAEEQQLKRQQSNREFYYSDEEKALAEHRNRLKELNEAGHSKSELADLTAKENQRYADVLSKRPEILKRVQDSMKSLDESFLRSSGNGLQADLNAVDEKWKQPKADLASLMMSEADPLQAIQYQQMLVKIDFVIDQEKLNLQLNDAKAKFQEFQNLQTSQLDNLKVQFDSGQISQSQFAEQANQIRDNLRPEMEKLVTTAYEYANAMGGVTGKQAQAEAQAMQQQLSQNHQEMAKFLPTTEQIQERIAGGMTDAIMAWADGTKSASEAFREFASSFLREMAQMILRQMVFNALKAITGYSDGGVVTGYATGGYTGSGGKYDPAGIVHKGEVVWSQEDIKAWGGVARVESMRKHRGYADGGVVAAPMLQAPTMQMPDIQAPKLNDPVAQIAQSTSFNASQNFYLVDDPARILDTLNSSKGQENIVVMMSRDPSKFKAALKIGG